MQALQGARELAFPFLPLASSYFSSAWHLVEEKLLGDAGVVSRQGSVRVESVADWNIDNIFPGIGWIPDATSLRSACLPLILVGDSVHSKKLLSWGEVVSARGCGRLAECEEVGHMWEVEDYKLLVIWGPRG